MVLWRALICDRFRDLVIVVVFSTSECADVVFPALFSFEKTFEIAPFWLCLLMSYSRDCVRYWSRSCLLRFSATVPPVLPVFAFVWLFACLFPQDSNSCYLRSFCCPFCLFGTPVFWLFCLFCLFGTLVLRLLSVSDCFACLARLCCDWCSRTRILVASLPFASV